MVVKSVVCCIQRPIAFGGDSAIFEGGFHGEDTAKVLKFYLANRMSVREQID